MTEEDSSENQVKVIKVASTRFDEMEVPEDCVISFSSGLVGFPDAKEFILIEHKPPFSWLHSTTDPDLAFVVIDGYEFGQAYEVKPPRGDKDIELGEEDEFGILIIVTVRGDPSLTTANLKAPLFINLVNKRGVQIILDDPRYSTRYPLWAEGQEGEQSSEGDKDAKSDPDQSESSD